MIRKPVLLAVDDEPGMLALVDGCVLRVSRTHRAALMRLLTPADPREPGRS